MPDTGDQQKAFAEQRRRKNEHLYADPWHRKAARSFERLSKKVSLRLLGKLLRITPINGPLPFDQIKSVLFLRPDGIGDAIVTTPLWRALKRRRPDIVIGVAGSFRNIPILEADPDVDYKYDFANPDKQDRRAEINRAREMKYDLVFGCTFHRTTKTAILARRVSPNGYTAYLLRGKPDNRVYLFSKMIFWEVAFESHMTLQLQHMMEETLGITLGAEEQMPSIHIPSTILSAGKEKISELHLQHKTSSIVVINTEAASSQREWGLENACTLAERLINEHPEVYVALTCSPHHADELNSYLATRSLPATIGYFSTQTIFDAAALISESALVISPDTAIIHVANALQKPVIGFYIKDNEWKPFNIPSYVFIPKKESPIASVRVDKVLAAANDLLDPHSQTSKENLLRLVSED